MFIEEYLEYTAHWTLYKSMLRMPWYQCRYKDPGVWSVGTEAKRTSYKPNPHLPFRRDMGPESISERLDRDDKWAFHGPPHPGETIVIRTPRTNGTHFFFLINGQTRYLELKYRDVPRTRSIYKITYPNGKIYILGEYDGRTNQFGGAMSSQLENDFTAEELADMTIRRELLWSRDDSTDESTANVKETTILEYQANNPDIGYNTFPKYKPEKPNSTQ